MGGNDAAGFDQTIGWCSRVCGHRRSGDRGPGSGIGDDSEIVRTISERACLRSSGAPIHTLDNAYYKAYSASLTLARKEDSTKAVAERMSKNPATTVPQTPLPNVTYAVGGVAIMAGGNIIGGIGVSGAPGGQFDEECARAGLGKIADR